MPRKDMHDLFEKLFLGELTGMSELMDSPHEFLHGQHRVLGHDPVQVGFLAIVKGGDVSKNFAAGLLHIFLDNAVSNGTKDLKQYVRHQNRLKGIKRHGKKKK